MFPVKTFLIWSDLEYIIYVIGAGGVAASKPVATAVVGPGGLAVARPVATAIAGISPEDAVIPIYADGYFKFPDKKKEKPSKDNCEKGDKCDKEDKEDKGNKKKEEKPKSDLLDSYYRQGIFRLQ